MTAISMLIQLRFFYNVVAGLNDRVGRKLERFAGMVKGTGITDHGICKEIQNQQGMSTVVSQ